MLRFCYIFSFSVLSITVRHYSPPCLVEPLIRQGRQNQPLPPKPVECDIPSECYSNYFHQREATFLGGFPRFENSVRFYK